MDRLAERERLVEEKKGAPAELAGVLGKTIREIDALMNDEEAEPEDPLVALWEAQMEAGIEPNLDLTAEDLKHGRTG